MCGICGVISVDDRATRDLARFVPPMMGAMRHRGPDEAGRLDEPGIALGMRRLSIIDRETGSQPAYNEDRTIAVVSNGEIYNFAALRRELIEHGHQFRSRCDTEVIVHAYEQWGDACLTHLRGMFALAIYDRPRRRLLLARDRLGIKPLYYTRVGGRLLFASEVRALLASGLVARELSRDGLESYLLFGSVSEPATLIEGVRSLPPGHALPILVDGPAIHGRATASAMSPAPYPYWTLPPMTAAPRNGAPHDRAPGGANGEGGWDGAKDGGRGANGRSSGNGVNAAVAGRDAAHVLRRLLEDSVDLHLVSDEPLGVFLSGGVDSTTIAALASRARSGVRCYTITLPRARVRRVGGRARRTARRLGVEHCELLVEPSEMLDDLDSALSALDQPSVDGINTYCVSAAVRRAGAKVALSGLGGDELFGGYRTFRWMPALGRLSTVARWTPRSRVTPARMPLTTAGAWTHSRGPDGSPGVDLARARRAAASVLLRAHACSVRRGGRVGEPSIGTVDAAPSMRARAGRSPGDRTGCATSAWRCWNDDTRAHGDGLRSVRRRLVLRAAVLHAEHAAARRRCDEHGAFAGAARAAARPSDRGVRGRADGGGEVAPRRLQAAARRRAPGDLLPREVSERPKRGFTFPWEQWMHGPLAPRVTTRLRDLAPALDPHLDRQAKSPSAWTAFQAGRNGWLRPWSLFVLDDWVRRHL